MSDQSGQNGGQEPGAQPDPFKNFKSEFDRKIDNVNNQVAELTKANQALLAQIASQTPKKTKIDKEDDIASLWYDNPAKAANLIEERAMHKIESKMAAANASQQKTSQVLNQLVYDYPELQSDSHDLTKKATALYMSMSEEEKRSPLAYKLAVKDAAAELNIVPRAKRNEDSEESFSMSSSNGTSSKPTKSSKKSGLAPETVKFAQLMGLNTEDPAVLKRIESRQRDNWNRYR